MTERQACNRDLSKFKAQANAVNRISVCGACALTLDTDRGYNTPRWLALYLVAMPSCDGCSPVLWLFPARHCSGLLSWRRRRQRIMDAAKGNHLRDSRCSLRGSRSPGRAPMPSPMAHPTPRDGRVLVIPLLSCRLQSSWETFLTKISLFSISVCGTKPRLHNHGSLCKCFVKGCLDTRGLSKYFLLIADRNAWKYFHTIFCLRKTWTHSLFQSRVLLIEDAPLMYCQRFGILRALGQSCFSGLKSSGKWWNVSEFLFPTSKARVVTCSS